QENTSGKAFGDGAASTPIVPGTGSSGTRTTRSGLTSATSTVGPILTERQGSGRSRLFWIFAWVFGAVVAAAGVSELRLQRRAGGGSDGVRKENDVPNEVARAGECTHTRECVDQHGGAAYICRRRDRRCVAIDSRDCAARAADLRNDDTLWIGGMFKYIT